MPSFTAKILQVDAFTDQPFAGNPAAVCFVEHPVTVSWMQNVAAEMNLAETAFVKRLGEDGGDFELRWFTPLVEVDLCGHATLATAHALWEEGVVSQEQSLAFQTASGILTAVKQADWIELDFPALASQSVTLTDDVIAALGLGDDSLIKFAATTKFDLLVELADATALRNLKPDFRKLAQLDYRGVMVTCRSDQPDYDFLSRFFAPSVGVDEDPVTGSAHCALSPYWSERIGKATLVGYQASRRGGVVQTHFNGDRVKLRGQAITTLRGEMVV